MKQNALIIVESPTKAKTIKKFLGRDYTILACNGHIRDLPSTAAEIPADVKKEKWSRIGINVADNFKPLYIIPGKKHKTLGELRKALKEADTLYLATDEDREGESISWHLLEVLKPKIPTKRMVFHEITQKAIMDALANPRDLDEKLVRAQETRRILDRLVGYTVSPLIWKKIAFGLSAGRVQSVALKALVDLERERMRFVSAKYWGVAADLAKGNDSFEAKLTHLGLAKIAVGKDFDEKTGKLIEKDGGNPVVMLNAAAAQTLLEEVRKNSWKIADLEEKPVSRKPAPPFITSTLQQEANRKLGLSARETMRIAQGLYERGFITYMRTDSVNLSESAIQSSRALVKKLYGPDYLSDGPRRYTSKAKGAQEAHEAIRPSLDFTPPQDMGLRGKEHDVYQMIWMRTIATQMSDSKQLQVSASIEVPTSKGQARFHSSGMKILFPGFLRAYVEGYDDPDHALLERERFLPDLKVGDTVKHVKSEVTEHETKPPARYSEASLIQFLEKEGIGRPSTYASIVSTILDRNYAVRNGNMLVPTFTGFVVTELMRKHFAELVDTKFTSNMEEKLDDIAEGKLAYLPYLKEFYLGKKGLEQRVADEDKVIIPEEARSLHFDHVKNLNVFVGKYGAYFEYTDPKTGEKVKASLPESMAPSDLNEESIHSLIEQVKKGAESLGTEPETKLPMYLKTGTYGPYIQLGETPTDPKQKLKRVSVPKGIDPNSVDEALAIRILGLPRLVGMHPATGKEIRASVGRFGPYVVHEKDFRSLKKEDSVLDVNLERALELFAQPKGKGRRSAVVRAMGEHPVTKSPVEILDGPYGLYVKHEKTNATIPKDRKPEELTMEEAVKLLAEREEQSPSKKSKGRAAKGLTPKPVHVKEKKAKSKAAKGQKGKKAAKTETAESSETAIGSRTAAKLAREIEKLRKENEKLREAQGKQST
ncbi:MAG: type I DNA topoisomerase [Bacteriovoracia bacterium]